MVVEYVSDRMLDPHLYFRLRYTGLVEQARTPGELDAAMNGLIAWINAGGLDAGQRQLLDESLSSRGLPCLEDLRERP